MLKATLLKAAGSSFLRRQVTANPIARRVADRFIAGDTLGEAEHAIRTLNAGGMSVALDYLGENTESEAQARESTASYLAAIDRIQDRGMDANISVKLTALGLDIRQELALEEASKVAARGKEVGAMVGVDMEAAIYAGRTLDIVEALKRDYDNVGVCVQSYLYRSRDDLERLNRLGIPVRLVKGAYQESPEVAYPEKASVDHAYARMLDDLLARNPFPMVATHDPAMVRLTKTLVARHRRDRDTFEFQMLYGVRPEEQKRLAADGHTVRVYVPYGQEWYGYLMRRLAERPQNLSFFLRSLISKK